MFRAFGLLFTLIAPIAAQKPFEFWPGTSYDARIPTCRKVLGYELGERITTHEGIGRYLAALAAASPRIQVFEYGESWEGRKLYYAAVASEANIKRLGEIRAAIQKLADPRKTPEAEARKLMANLPAVLWLSYGVHGNEISSPDAALLVAYHLLAARNDKTADQILANAVVLINPTQNPDGRDRFIHHFEESRGLEPDPSPAAAEHNEPWPGGRSNHYLFDMNRDWFAQTQPEIRAQAKVLLQWFPLVCVDLHEMGGNSSYFFSPASEPYNPHLLTSQRESLKLFGRNNAKYFDRFGFDYFTRDVFDAFYPGYGDSWPAHHGAISMTYEQASVRGLVLRRSDETSMHFRDSVRHHFVASLATAETAALNREKLIGDFYRYRASAVEEGSKETVKEYVIVRGRDGSAADKLAGLLVTEGIEVMRATAPFHNGGREFPAGSYVVRMAQPAKRLARNLLDPAVEMDPAFIKAEEIRRRTKQRSEIYDVTAWSLPLMFNVETVGCADVSEGQFQPAKETLIQPGEIRGGTGSVAYVVGWGSAAAGRLLAAALREDLRVFSSDKSFTVNGRTFPSGSLIFKVKDNPPDLHQRLARLAQSSGADVWGTDTAWVDDGVNFGSRYVVWLRKPAIAMAWDTPTQSSAAGAARFVLERQFGYPVTAIRTSQIGATDLSRFNVLILPPGGPYAQVLGAGGTRRIKEWVAAGGTLIGMAEAVAYMCDRGVELLAIAPETLAREGERTEPASPGARPAPPTATAAPSGTASPADSRATGKVITSDADYRNAIRAERESPDSVPGVLLRARFDENHWMSAGMNGTVNALVYGGAIYTPVKLDKGVNAAYFESPEKVLASGYLWEENRKQLAYKPLVVVQPEGRGTSIGFTADPTFRGYMDGMNVLLLNAVFRGPAHARTGGREE